MKVYVPIVLATGTFTYDITDDTPPHKIREIIKASEPTEITINSLKPNYDAIRLTPEADKRYE